MSTTGTAGGGSSGTSGDLVRGGTTGGSSGPYPYPQAPIQPATFNPGPKGGRRSQKQKQSRKQKQRQSRKQKQRQSRRQRS